MRNIAKIIGRPLTPLLLIMLATAVLGRSSWQQPTPLPEPPEIVGYVISESGDAVPDAKITVFPRPFWPAMFWGNVIGSERVVQSSNEGRFAIPRAAGGRKDGLRFYVQKNGYALYTKTLHDGPGEDLGRIVLRPGRACQIAVRREDETPVEGAQVLFLSDDVGPFPYRYQVAGDQGFIILGYTDASGLVVLDDLPARSVGVVIASPGLIPRRVLLSPEQSTAEVRLRRGARIVGSVSSSELHDLSAVRAHALSTPDDRFNSVEDLIWNGVASSYVDADGEFSIEGLVPADSYRIVLSNRNGEFVTDMLRVEPGAPPVRLAWNRPCALQARVVSAATGERIERFQVTVVGHLELGGAVYVPRSFSPKDDGSFTVDGYGTMQPGTYTCSIKCAGYDGVEVGPILLTESDRVRDLGVLRLQPRL